MEKIYLVGFMASGKTTVGKILSQKLGWQFIDIDEEIERSTQKKINEIFSSFGEDYFRKLEVEMLTKFKDLDKLVISVGGGLPVFFNNMEILKSTGFTVYLEVDEKIILERLKKEDECSKRPLASSMNAHYLKNLLNARKPIYVKSHKTIKCAQKKPDEIAEEIIEEYKKWKLSR
jgi:shikimate kinase